MQTDGQADRQTPGRTDTQTDKLVDRHADRLVTRQTDTQTNDRQARQVDKQINNQTEEQLDTQTETDRQTANSNRQKDSFLYCHHRLRVNKHATPGVASFGKHRAPAIFVVDSAGILQTDRRRFNTDVSLLQVEVFGIQCVLRAVYQTTMNGCQQRQQAQPQRQIGIALI